MCENNKEYEIIGVLANNSDKLIYVGDLSNYISGSGRGLYRKVSAAYRYFRRKNDEKTAENIAKTYVDKNGNYAYDNYD